MVGDALGRQAVEVLGQYDSGPGATSRATAQALRLIHHAEAVVMVEGISDQIAFETLARYEDRDLQAEGVVVVPVGGTHGAERYLRRFEALPGGVVLAGFFDADQEEIFMSSLRQSQIGNPRSRAEMEELGFFVCVEDLEDELIRAVGVDGVEAVMEDNGDLKSFRTFQKQPNWHGRDLPSQMKRWVGSKARRKLVYACLLTEAAAAQGRAPEPLEATLDHV